MHESLPIQEQDSFREPIGIRIIGHRDPRTMTRAEFDASPDALYHAAREHFELDQYFSYDDLKNYEHSLLGEGGLTLGAGLYATPELREGRNYMRIRGGNSAKLYTLVPYLARMLDLRCKDQPSENGDLSKMLVDEWRELIHAARARIVEGIQKKTKIEFMDRIRMERWEEYANYLDAIHQSGQSFDLRTVLGTGIQRSARGRFPEITVTPAPPWIALWTRFMLHKGIDGVLYHEGSEVEDKDSLNAVFYNLEKVGTYASWHRDRGHGAF